MNLTVPKATAKLIIAITEPHVEKALNDGDTNAALALQSIITNINTAMEINLPIHFK